MDKTVVFVEFLINWQNISHEQVETVSDIEVFNVIGTIIQLVKNNYMSHELVYRFLTCLSLSDEVKDKIKNILDNADKESTTVN